MPPPSASAGGGGGLDLKKLPPWAWALAIAGGAVVGFVFLRKGAGAEAGGEENGDTGGARQKGEGAVVVEPLAEDMLSALGLSPGDYLFASYGDSGSGSSSGDGVGGDGAGSSSAESSLASQIESFATSPAYVGGSAPAPGTSPAYVGGAAPSVYSPPSTSLAGQAPSTSLGGTTTTTTPTRISGVQA